MQAGWLLPPFPLLVGLSRLYVYGCHFSRQCSLAWHHRCIYPNQWAQSCPSLSYTNQFVWQPLKLPNCPCNQQYLYIVNYRSVPRAHTHVLTLHGHQATDVYMCSEHVHVLRLTGLWVCTMHTMVIYVHVCTSLVCDWTHVFSAAVTKA